MQCSDLQPEWIVLHEINSTNTFLKQRIADGAHLPTIVCADRQTSGKGRKGRTWQSPEGGLYMSIGVQIPEDGISPVYYGVAASVAIAGVLQKKYAIDARLKWPNDILVHGRKLCGILTELVTLPDAPAHIITGIGLNANASIYLNDAMYDTTSIRDITGERIDLKDLRRRIASAVLQAWRDMQTDTAETIRKQWVASSATINQQVEIHTNEHIITGTAVDIDDTFQLIVNTSNGRQAFCAGDCRITSL